MITYHLEKINTALAKAIECLARDPKRAERLLADVKRWVGELAAAQASAEAQAEQFIQAAIDRSPEPLRRLGEYLARVLDEDQWKAAERMLLGAAEDSAKGAEDVVAWTNDAGDMEPISDAVKRARPDLYAKHHTRPLVFADRQQPKTYRDSADFHSNASTAELAAWQRGWNDCREADRQQRGGDDFSGVQPPMRYIAGVNVDVLRRAALAIKKGKSNG